jgi:Ni,Fe-hydrogenase III large subunit
MLPYAAYSTVVPNESTETEGGDVLSRFSVKFAEVEESSRLIRHILSGLPHGALSVPMPAKTVPGIGVGWSEAARGGCTFLVDIGGNGAIRRLALRSASFRNWRALEKAVEGNIIPDFPLVNKSFNLSYAGTDM